MKKYSKIVRYPKTQAKRALESYNFVFVSEKIDGANGSFKLTEDGTKIECFSRNIKLGPKNTLNGFYNFVQENVPKSVLFPGVIYFGEWLTKHRVNYPEGAQKKFYLFDLYFEPEERYYPPTNEAGVHVVEKVGDVFLAPMIYVGKPLDDVDNYKSFLHQESNIGAEKPEGIVIKDYEYVDRRKKSQLFVKMVNDEFLETQKKKKKHKKEPEYTEREQELLEIIDEFVSKNGVEKYLLKQVDEGVIEKPYDSLPFSELIKKTKKGFVKDVMEENSDELDLMYSKEEKFVKKNITRQYVEELKKIVTV